MLQQTQVAVVVPYFLRWMEQFPTVESLAQAPLDQVIKAWEGLGYYSRARRLHAGAQFIVEQFGGQLPQTSLELGKIKGLGPYTIGAILSFAFHQKAAAVDGNVLRVIARYFALDQDIAKPSTVKYIREKVEAFLPDEEPWIINEALIELGATICQKKPRCWLCPLRSSCQALAQGRQDQLPVKSKTGKTEFLFRAVPVIFHQDSYLIKRGKKGEIMSDLHEFPFFETDQMGLSKEMLQAKVEKEWGLSLSFVKELPLFSHSFTRYQVRLNPVLFICQDPLPIEGLEWKSLATLKTLAFSSGHRRLFQALL
jgi:A/G-specific adenine glycosylase